MDRPPLHQEETRHQWPPDHSARGTIVRHFFSIHRISFRLASFRMISALAALLMLGASTTAASAEEVQVIREGGMPISIAQAGYRYRSSLSPANGDTVVLDNGVRVEVWKLQARPGQCFDITMRSADFDSLLMVYSGPGFRNHVTTNDDSGGGQNGYDARVTMTSHTGGTYYLVAAPATRNEPSGRYTLEIGQCSGGSGNPAGGTGPTGHV